jgi:hypothetical protein
VRADARRNLDSIVEAAADGTAGHGVGMPMDTVAHRAAAGDELAGRAQAEGAMRPGAGAGDVPLPLPLKPLHPGGLMPGRPPAANAM